MLCVCFVDRRLSFCTFCSDHCVVCSSPIYGFWLPLWYLQTLLTFRWDDDVRYLPILHCQLTPSEWNNIPRIDVSLQQRHIILIPSQRLYILLNDACLANTKFIIFGLTRHEFKLMIWSTALDLDTDVIYENDEIHLNLHKFTNWDNSFTWITRKT